MADNYGSGLTKFTSGDSKHVLELGNKVHYYNPSATPLFTLLGRISKRSTPVPKFEWMEDEHFLKRSMKITFAAVETDTAYAKMNRQAQMEGIEVGNVYKATPDSSGIARINGGSAGVAAILVVLDHGQTAAGADSPLSVKFGKGTMNSDDSVFTFSTTAAVFALSASEVGEVQFEYLGTVGHAVRNATNASVHNVHGAKQGYAEGADVAGMSTKKVRRLANYTQIFREPYNITRTARVSKQYGEQEMARLQARKLAKIKGDIEWALLTNGAGDADASAEMPRRRFSAFGVGQAAGAGLIQTNDGRGSSDFQWDFSDGIDDLDRVVANIFVDQLSGSMVKTAFCSNKWMKELVKAVRASAGAQFESGMGKDIKAGLRVSSYMGPIGQVDFIQHPYLNDVHEDYALIVDFGNAEMRALSQSDMQLRKDIVKSGQDGSTDEWLYEGGPEIRNEQTHAILKLV